MIDVEKLRGDIRRDDGGRRLGALMDPADAKRKRERWAPGVVLAIAAGAGAASALGTIAAVVWLVVHLR